MPSAESAELIRRMAASTEHYFAPEQVLIHTELNKDIESHFCTKNRAVVLSALATQSNAVVWLWATEPWDEASKRCFQDILDHPELGSKVELRHFDPAEEVAQILDFSKEDRELYASAMAGAADGAVNPNLSDLRRYLMLYNYGGYWVDTDTLLLRNMFPLHGYSWVYECSEWQSLAKGLPRELSLRLKWIMNGAVMGTSGPQSLFIGGCMRKVLDDIRTGSDNDYFKWAGSTFKALEQQAIEAGQPNPFLVMPCVWFDPAWDQGFPKTGLSRKYVWSGNATADDVDRLLEAESTFAMHLHGETFVDPVLSPTSFGSQALRRWEKQLGLGLPDD